MCNKCKIAERWMPIDYAAILPPLLAAGYRGHFGLEYLPQGDALAELADVCRYFQLRVAGSNVG